LSEGLAEYFATAEITDDAIYLGAVSPERLELLKGGPPLTIKDMLAIDDQSPYYNDTVKANVFYAEAWAFVHFLTHGPYQEDFKRYLEALVYREVPFSDFVKKNLDDLDHEFDIYLKTRIRLIPREKLKSHPDGWQMTADPITDADVELAITEIFLSGGRLDLARKHLERVTGIDDEFPRASFYRGVLARLTHQGDPKEFFIDALMDLNLGPRAAVNLVQLHELSIPAARRALEQAAASGTHMSDVYWALSEIYLDDANRAKEILYLSRTNEVGSARPAEQRQAGDEPPPILISYGRGDGDHFKYELLSPSGAGPRAQAIVAPFFPEELLKDRLSGNVALDIQVQDDGAVGGVWLISASPEIFSDLAIAAVRDWKFEAIPGKIRIVVQFIP